MKIELSKDNIGKIVWGGVYTALGTDIEKYYSRYTDGLNDQKYGFWIPTHSKDKETGEDKYYMIDTYQVSGDLYEHKYSYNKDEEMEGLVQGLERAKEPESGGNWIARMPFNYYYSAIIRLTDENFEIFKLMADLHEYKITDEREARNYSEEDVFRRVKLYYEHAYSIGGITLVRKDAKLNYNNMINAKIYDVLKDIQQPSSCFRSYIIELEHIEEDAKNNNAKYNEKKLDAVLKYNNFVENLKTIHDRYLKEIKDDLYSELDK